MSTRQTIKHCGIWSPVSDILQTRSGDGQDRDAPPPPPPCCMLPLLLFWRIMFFGALCCLKHYRGDLLFDVSGLPETHVALSAWAVRHHKPLVAYVVLLCSVILYGQGGGGGGGGVRLTLNRS